MPFENKNLDVSISGVSDLQLLAFSGRERLSQLFEFQLDIVAPDVAIDPTTVIKKSCSFGVIDNEQETRWFNGIVSAFTWCGFHLDLRHYRATVVPTPWLLTRRADCRIFHEQTVQDIVSTVLGDIGYSDYSFSLSGTLPTWEYCTQYRESDFQFISRLLEEAGLYYFFKHEEGKHTMVISDAVSGYADCAVANVDYAMQVRADQIDDNIVCKWSRRISFVTGQVAQTDYSFLAPTTPLLVTTSTIVPLSDAASFEVFDYPGKYWDKSEGTALGKTRMEEIEAEFEVSQGNGSCLYFSPGHKFTLTNYQLEGSEAAEYVAVDVMHAAREPASFRSGSVGRLFDIADPISETLPASRHYFNQFTAIPAAVCFRPPRITPKAVVEGPQTAMVVGEGEIDVDEHGRVLVKFHWDRAEAYSCRVRVAQLWAGKAWGAMFIPRVGHEVVVDFVEGDPDHPLITGRVYNADHTVPYALPDNKTQSGIKSRSSAEGADADFNELRFEDLKDSEEIYFHAQKDFNRIVENNDTLTVGSSEADDGSQSIDIWNKRTKIIHEGDEAITLEKGNQTVDILKGNQTITLGEGNRSLVISKGSQTTEVTEGDREVKVAKGKQTTTVESDYAITVNSGKLTIDVSSSEIAITASTKITLTVGSSSIKIESAKITLQSTEIAVSGDSQVEIKGATVKNSGSAMVQDQGGVVKIN